MADPERRSSRTDPDEVDDPADEPTAGATDDASDEGEAVSEVNALDGHDGDSDAPDEEPGGESDVAQADPRAAQTGGADDAVGADGDEDEDVPAVAGTKKAGKSRGAKPSTVKAKKDPDEDAATGAASRSGNPARKAGAEKEKPASKVSRTPAKPKRIGNRWAAPAMLAAAGIGLAWIVIFYVTQDRIDIPWYSDLGSWNLVIGMGFIVAAFGFAMKWE